ncbi:hypothetical protein HAV35_13745 [Deinococcus radiodurans]|nr:hypothetical protein HAV35_13745 [Deinococcus radiodurans]
MSAAQRGYFLAYQVAWLNDDSRLKIAEKSRRIGWTYTQAYEDVRDAAKEGGMDVWFSSADLTAAREYIRYVQMWARILNVVATDLGEVVLEGSGESAIKAFVVAFANGKRITALSSNPKGFRSKGARSCLTSSPSTKTLMNSGGPPRRRCCGATPFGSFPRTTARTAASTRWCRRRSRRTASGRCTR